MNEERQEYLIRCMNAAVNLYGVLSFDEMIGLYNQLATDKPVPVCDPLTAVEIEAVLALPRPDDTNLDAFEMWFGHGTVDGMRYLVQRRAFYPPSDNEDAAVDESALRDQLEDFRVPMLRVLPEDDFLTYEDPLAFEMTGVTKRFAKFLRAEYSLNRNEAEMCAWDLQQEIRICPSMSIALISARNTLRLTIEEQDDLDDLVDVLISMVRNTRAWNYRGYTETELVNDGLVDGFEPIDGGYGYELYLGDLKAAGNSAGACGESYPTEDDDWEPDAWDTERLSDDELASILPSADYPKEPVDFTFVKDPARREQVLADYDNVRNVTVDFVREVLMKRLSSDARAAAKRRLGFPEDNDYSDPLVVTLDRVAGDFASMLDDQCGTPLIRQILADIDKLDKYHRLGAAYYRNYRYCWLLVQAVKAGVGLKCRNLITGEDLFLMERRYSCGADLKGSLICAGIAPMGSVYLCLGTLHPANFDPPEVVLRIIRQKLGLPLDGPLYLSPADEARFAAETIRRLNTLGKFSAVWY